MAAAVGLDLALDDAQQAIADEVARFCAARCGDDVVKQSEGKLPLELWKELLAVCPEFTVAWYAVGVAAAHRDDHDLTLEAFAKVLERNPRSIVANYRRGIANFYKGDLDEAITSFGHVIDINPDHKGAKENLRALEDMRMRFS